MLASRDVVNFVRFGTVAPEFAAEAAIRLTTSDFDGGHDLPDARVEQNLVVCVSKTIRSFAQMQILEPHLYNPANRDFIVSARRIARARIISVGLAWPLVGKIDAPAT